MYKNKIFTFVDTLTTKAAQLSDYIFDCAELGNNEFKSSAAIENYLQENGFTVEHGIATLPTAFRATWEKGNGGPSIGFLCEYDALENMGHACGHQMQGPAIATAAIALANCIEAPNFKIVVYGTPAEETTCGKVTMLKEGCFKDIDVALMFHGNPTTSYDDNSMAMSSYNVTFRGKSSHAAIQPEAGRSALDALLLAFQGIEFMREHVKEDTRMHYTVLDAGGPSNVVPAQSVGSFTLRSYSRKYLDSIVERFRDIIQGAALMTGTQFEIAHVKSLDNRIPVPALNDNLMENARLVHAPCIRPPRAKNGSSDFGNVMYALPGACLRVAFVPEGTSSHTQAFYDAGKTEAAHNAIAFAAKILAATAADLILSPTLLDTVKEQFKQIKAKL